jgi:hypothetical protein
MSSIPHAMHMTTDKKAQRLRAQLQWEAACERLAFALSPPAGMDPSKAPDLQAALALAQAALDELRAAWRD